MIEYWSRRLAEAMRQSRSAPTPALRAIHLRTAAHYQSLIRFSLPRASAPSLDRLAA